MPRIGDRVFLGAGASILGAVTLGDDVFVGTGAVVMEDVPSNSKVVAKHEIEIVTSSSRSR